MDSRREAACMTLIPAVIFFLAPAAQRHDFIPPIAIRHDMKKDRKKIREPFKPENTPSPPQIIEPEGSEKRKPVEDKPGKRQGAKTEGKSE